MIYLNLQLTNPWSNFFKVGRVWSGKLFGNKFWEFQAMRTHDIAVAKLEVTTRQDHAGLSIELGLVSFNIAFTVYDNRHWDYIGEKWTHYND